MSWFKAISCTWPHGFLYLNAVFKVICLIFPRSKMFKILILICMLSICGAIDNLFDHKLYENVLDSELCDRQLQSMNEFECKYRFDIKGKYKFKS